MCFGQCVMLSSPHFRSYFFFFFFFHFILSFICCKCVLTVRMGGNPCRRFSKILKTKNPLIICCHSVYAKRIVFYMLDMKPTLFYFAAVLLLLDNIYLWNKFLMFIFSDSNPCIYKQIIQKHTHFSTILLSKASKPKLQQQKQQLDRRLQWIHMVKMVLRNTRKVKESAQKYNGNKLMIRSIYHALDIYLF